jgi:ribosomal protein S18 acetylase RimI-like enzyme
MTITLRQATPHDSKTIHRLVGELAASVDDVEKFQSKPEDFELGLNAKPPAFEAVLAEQAGTAVGICLYFPSFSSWRGTPGVYVQDLYVSEMARGSGLGARLLRHVAAAAQKRGATYVRLAVDTENTDGQRFYDKMGMRWADSDRIFVIDGGSFTALTT